MRRAFTIAAISCVVAFLLTWTIDLLRIRHLMNQGRGVSTVHVESVDAVTLKNGSTDFYVNPPQDVPCVESLFPHNGLPTCWKLRRNAQKQNEYFKDKAPKF
jgi:hypothetical protein